MPRLFETTVADAKKHREELLEQFPGAKMGAHWDLNYEVLLDFKAALAAKSEEAIQLVLTANPYLIQYALPQSGHHGVWVFPKPMIRPTAVDGVKGMIPDYLVASRSSLGYYWHIVELKRSDVQFSNRTGAGYSRDGQAGIAQCNGYLAHFQDYIDAVRSNVRVPELIQPEGAILLIGDSAQETEAQKACRANFVRNNTRIDIVSYQRILGHLEADLRAFGKAG